jgi:hypothetical protein
MGRKMKTTIDLPDDLYRQAKAEAVRRGRELNDMIEEGLRRVLHEPSKSEETRRELTLEDLMGEYCGIFDSGIGDLATNPKYMAGYGRSKNDV